MTAHLRRGPDRPYPRDDQGRPLCRMCRKLIKPPRRWWCGDECVEKRRLETLTAREMVEDRDKGVCVLCGMDTEAFRRRAQRARGLLAHLMLGGLAGSAYHPRLPILEDRMRLWLARRVRAASILTKAKVDVQRSWWEADHIHPLIEGGAHTIDNIRTLCIWCHKAETAKLAGRRAAEKRQESDEMATDTGGPTC